MTAHEILGCFLIAGGYIGGAICFGVLVARDAGRDGIDSLAMPMAILWPLFGFVLLAGECLFAMRRVILYFSRDDECRDSPRN